MALYNKEQIMEIIPHRDPFLLIDEVEELEVGKRVVATKFISPDSFWFQGHFPGHPVTPGVLIIEMLAQAGAVCALSMPENQGKIAFFAGIDKAKFRRQVLPATRSASRWRCCGCAVTSAWARGPRRSAAERAASAEITFALMK